MHRQKAKNKIKKSKKNKQQEYKKDETAGEKTE